MIVNYGDRSESTMPKMSTKTPNENMGNVIPKSEESIQTYPRGKDVEHPDEAMEQESPIDGMKLKDSVKEYPRHG